MKELETEICKLIKLYFDKKLKGFNFWDDPLEDKIEDMVENVIEDMTDMLEETDRDIDWELEEFNEKQAERDWVMAKKLEQKRNLEIDRSLGLL